MKVQKGGEETIQEETKQAKPTYEQLEIACNNLYNEVNRLKAMHEYSLDRLSLLIQIHGIASKEDKSKVYAEIVKVAKIPTNE